ncbi:DUF2339 domain-containing protein [Flavobacterium sp. HSC-61S13]|uniref:DUF2339 domain-containing protein n=1 Tax=Flavobacterium sp. HSC-61S13 TaxID=2910963 RepID=UPI0020A1B1E0|nr:DUF2339 domain-containing protein [Flavobacterium sp. HSC-61S13]MCP1996588.1 putative membrane protein [Flavobacterium sp. HSC-61S13]
MEGFIFLMVIVILAVIVLFIVGLVKIFSTHSKLDSLFVRLGSVEQEIHKLSVMLKENSIQPLDSKAELVVEEVVSERQTVQPINELKEVIANLDPIIVPAPIVSNIEIGEETIVTADQDLDIVAPVVAVKSPMPEQPQAQDNRLKYPRKKSALELFFSDNILTKIGIITFVLGIGFFVKYAIDQEWINEVGRVGIGILTGAMMIGIAHRLRKSLNVFSSLLVGGGISVFYITITLAFREYELFSQTVAFILLIIITGFSVALSLLYNRKELAVFSLLGGFMAPLMVSTGIGNYVVLFSYLLILNSGMLYLSFKKNWIIIGYIAFVLTAIFKMTWVANGFVDQYLGASIFAGLFFLQFYIVVLANTAKDKKVTPHIILIILNNMVFLGVFLYLFNDYQGVNLRGLIVMIFALVNAAVLYIFWKKQKINSLYLYTVLGVVISLVTLAVPIQLNGHYITMFWAVESVVLLVLFIKSKLKIFYNGFLLVSFSGLISYIMDISAWSVDSYTTFIFNPLFITGLVVFTSFFATQKLLSRYDIKYWGANLYPTIVRVIGYVVPMLEINKELELLGNTTAIGSLNVIVFLVYSATFAAIVFLLSSKSKLNYVVNGLFLFVVTLFFWGNLGNFRMEIFVKGVLNVRYFLISFLAIPALIVLLRQFYNHPNYSKSPKIVRWMLPLSCLILISVWIDNCAVLLNGMNGQMSFEAYRSILKNTHVIVYPVVWGGIALLLTFIGIKKHQLFLRQIALALLGLTIVKFYIIDVWSMSEGGKVLSFVLLGLIILVIAFLLNRIKGLLGGSEPKIDQEESSDQVNEQE